MYYDGSVGDVIRKLRYKRGISQEQLSEKVDCTTGTISRIENGSQEPNRSMLIRILDQLGEPGFFCDYYLEKDSLRIFELERLLLISYENRCLSKFETYFDCYQNMFDKDNTLERQFYEMLKLLYLEWIGEKSNMLEKLESIMKMTIKEYSIGKSMDGMLLGEIEIIILNNITIELIKSGKYHLARGIIRHLVYYLSKSKYFLPSLIKAKSGMYNNLALCEKNIGSIRGALASINKAIELFSYEGGVLFMIRIMKTKWYIEKSFGLIEESMEDYYKLKMMCGLMSKRKIRDFVFTDFLKESCYIRVF